MISIAVDERNRSTQKTVTFNSKWNENDKSLPLINQYKTVDLTSDSLKDKLKDVNTQLHNEAYKDTNSNIDYSQKSQAAINQSKTVCASNKIYFTKLVF